MRDITLEQNHNTTNYRRLKAITIVISVWSIISLMHLIPITRWFMLVLTLILTWQAVRMLITKPKTLINSNEAYLPTVTILVPAKNESIVLPNIVESLFHLDYPASRHGVTSVVIGNCSLSVAIGAPQTLADIFQRVETLSHRLIEKWLQKSVSWQTPKEYLQHLQQLPL